MRHFSSVLLILLVVVGPFACQRDRSILQPVSVGNYSVSLEHARTVATSLQIGDSITTSRLSTPNARSAKKFREIKREYQLKDAATNEVEMYVFNYNDGFVAISGDRRLIPILAFSPNGSFDDDLDNVGIQDWLQSTKKAVKAIRKENKAQSKLAQELWRKFDAAPANPSTGPGAPPAGPQPYDLGSCGNTVGPLLTSTWDQGIGYNFNCPAANGGPCDKAWAGCVATAIGQIARYWHHSGGEYFNYSIMDDAVSPVCNPPTNEQEIARLLRRIGDKVDMSWGANASGAQTDKAPNCFRDVFGYSSGGTYTGNLNPPGLMTNIGNGWPMIMRGEGTGAHAWVLDGYVQCAWSLGPGMGSSYWWYYHMNWGWGGQSNGWYYYTSAQPSGTSHDFGTDRRVVMNIHP
jgi:hypothetical protein